MIGRDRLHDFLIDGIGLLGVTNVVIGAYLAYPPAALILGGAFAIYAAIRLAPREI